MHSQQAQLSGSAKSLAVLDDGVKTTLHYAPLTYRQRGELANLYAPLARSPIDAFEAMMQEASPEDVERQGGEEWAESMRRQLRAASAGWEPSPEDPAAQALFLSNLGRPEGDPRDYRAAFLAVVLAPRHPKLDEAACERYVGMLTKGQLLEIYNYALEVGPYTPK